MHYEFIVFDDKGKESLITIKPLRNDKTTLVYNFKHIATAKEINFSLLTLCYTRIKGKAQRIIMRLVNCDDKLKFTEQQEYVVRDGYFDPYVLYDYIKDYMAKVKC